MLSASRTVSKMSGMTLTLSNTLGWATTTQTPRDFGDFIGLGEADFIGLGEADFGESIGDFLTSFNHLLNFGLAPPGTN